MDARHFDTLTRVLATPDTRRRLLGLLATLPLLGHLLGWLAPDDTLAKERRRRRKGRHKKRQGKARAKGKRQQRTRACKPKGKATVCAGTCGAVKSRQTCGKRVDCGSCDCPTPCAACLTCQAGPNSPGTCVPDPEQVGEPCGSPGQVCASDGTCACSTGSCAACEECGGDGVCTGCSGCCDGETCVAACPPCTLCDDKQCVPCPGCCDSGGVCQDGDTNTACGAGGGDCAICTLPETCDGGAEAGACGCTPTTCADEGKNCGQIDDGCGVMLACGSCSGSTPICISNVCTACSSHTQCGAGKACVEGSCLACDVTCGAADHTCDATALQTALAGGGTVVVCPGLYTGTVSVESIASVTMIGAGMGDDPAMNTVLRDLAVISVTTFAMSHARVHGFAAGDCEADNGIYIKDSGATLTDCAIANIGPKFCNTNNNFQGSTVEMVNCLVTGSYLYGAGGLFVSGGKLTVRGSALRNNFTLGRGGGLYVANGAVVKLLDGTTVTENRADDKGGGIYVSAGAEVTLERSTVTDNKTRLGGDGGGGIYADTGVKVTISADSSVTGNILTDPNNPSHTEPNNCAGPGTIEGTCGP